MDRTKLKLNQISGLIIFGAGVMIEKFSPVQNGLIFVIFGLLVFFVSSKLSKGIYLSLIILTIGYLFKIMHYSDPNLIILFGLIGLTVFGLIEYVYKNYRTDLFLIYISTVIILIGIYIRIIHFNFGMELTILGITSLTLSYFYRFFKKTKKIFDDYNKAILVLFWSMSYLLIVFHLPWSNIISVVFIISFWLWIIMSFIREMKFKN